MNNSERHVSEFMSRRKALGLLGAFSVVGLAACADDGGSSSAKRASGSSSSTPAAAAVNVIPEETAGPFPGDGSNGPDVLTQSGVVRSDIRPSFGSYTGTAEGVPTTVRLTVLDTENQGKALAGAAVYVWHCDREGRYSLYSSGATDQNYLRGVQPTDADGVATFTSIFPACYSGRWPHIHFEIYPSVDAATSAGTKLATSQIALPKDACDVVFATDGYSASVSNLARTSLSTDNVFSDDGGVHELATVTGSATDGYVVALTAGVSSVV